MNVKMMAVLLSLALACGCARVPLTLLPDEHLWAEGHKVSVPKLTPVPVGEKGDGRGSITLETCIIGMTTSFDRQFGVSKLVGKKVGLDDIHALYRSAEASSNAIITSSPRPSVLSGAMQGMDLSTTGTYVSDYALSKGCYVPVLTTYSPDVFSSRLKATLDGDTIVLEKAEVLNSDCYLIDCTAKFGIPSESKVSKVTLTWCEPVQEKHTAALKESVRLKLNEGIVFELSGTLERGVSNLRVPLRSSEISEKGYRGAGGTTERMIYYAIIVPTAITPADPKTAGVAH